MPASFSLLFSFVGRFSVEIRTVGTVILRIFKKETLRAESENSL